MRIKTACVPSATATPEERSSAEKIYQAMLTAMAKDAEKLEEVRRERHD
jgi:hypothetical protein